MSIFAQETAQPRAEWVLFCRNLQNKYSSKKPFTIHHIRQLSIKAGVHEGEVTQKIAKLFLRISGNDLYRIEYLKKCVPRSVISFIDREVSFHNELCRALESGDIELGYREAELVIQKLVFNDKNKKQYPILYKWFVNPSMVDSAKREARLLNKIDSSFSYILSPAYQILFWKGVTSSKKEIFEKRKEIMEGANHLFAFLNNPEEYVSIEDPGQKALVEIKMLSTIFKGFIFQNYRFIDAICDWSLLSSSNKKTVIELRKFLSLVELFAPFEARDNSPLSIFKDFKNKDSFQNFLIEYSLFLLKDTYTKKRGYYPFDDLTLFPLFQSEEIRSDVMAYLVFCEQALLIDLPPFDPSRSHSLFTDHRLFLEMSPEISSFSILSERKEHKRACDPSSIRQKDLNEPEYVKTECHFYHMIQNRDQDLNYKGMFKRISKQDFWIAYSLLREYQEKIEIEKANELYFFLNLVFFPQKVAQVFVTVNILQKEFSIDSSKIFFGLVKNLPSENITSNLSSLLRFKLLRLTTPQILKIIDQSEEVDFPVIIDLYKQFQESLPLITLTEEVSIELQAKILENSYRYLQTIISKQLLLDTSIQQQELCSFGQVMSQIAFTHLSSFQKVELWFEWIEQYGKDQNLLKETAQLLILLKNTLGFPLLQDDSYKLLKAHPNCTSWIEAIRLLHNIEDTLVEDTLVEDTLLEDTLLEDPLFMSQGKKREWDHFSMSPELHRSREKSVESIKVLPLEYSQREEYEDFMGALATKVERYLRIALFSTYQHLYDNFHVKSFRNEKAIYSISETDKTDVLYDHSGIFFSNIPGISMMSCWDFQDNHPVLVVVYIREVIGESFQARILIEELDFPININELSEKEEEESVIQSSENILEDPLLLTKCPELIKEKPEYAKLVPSILKETPYLIKLVFNKIAKDPELEKKFSDLLKDRSKYFKTTSGAVIVSEELIQKIAEIISEYPFLLKNTESSFLEQFLSVLKVLMDKGLLEGNEKQKVLNLTSENVYDVYPDAEDMLDEIHPRFGTLTLQLENLSKKKLYSGSTDAGKIAYSFLSSLKVRSREYWRQTVKGAIPDSVKELKSIEQMVKLGIIVSESQEENRVFYDDGKKSIPYKYQALTFIPKGSSIIADKGLTSSEITEEVVQIAHHLIKTSKEQQPLGLIKKGSRIGAKVRLVDHQGTYRKGALFLSSQPILGEDEQVTGYKVILGVDCGEKQIATQPFVYSLNKLNDPEHFSKYLSTQLMLLKILYCRKSAV